MVILCKNCGAVLSVPLFGSGDDEFIFVDNRNCAQNHKQ